MKKILMLSFVLGHFFSIAQEVKKDEIVCLNKKQVIKYEVMHKIDNALSQNVKPSLIKGFSTGNAQTIGAHFNTNVEIALKGKNDLYSKSQGIQVLKTFFENNSPSAFEIIHEGNSNNLNYYIGNLTTSKGKFRITINMKSLGGKEVITRLTIEQS